MAAASAGSIWASQTTNSTGLARRRGLLDLLARQGIVGLDRVEADRGEVGGEGAPLDQTVEREQDACRAASMAWRCEAVGPVDGDRKHQADREHGAAARLALDGDVAAHGARQTARDGEAEAGSAAAQGGLAVALVELAEQPANGLARQADAGILDADGDADAAFA